MGKLKKVVKVLGEQALKSAVPPFVSPFLQSNSQKQTIDTQKVIDNTPIQENKIELPEVDKTIKQGDIEAEGKIAEISDGRVFLGLNKDDIKKLAAGQKEKFAMPENVESFSKDVQQQQRIDKINELLPQLNQVERNPEANISRAGVKDVLADVGIKSGVAAGGSLAAGGIAALAGGTAAAPLAVAAAPAAAVAITMAANSIVGEIKAEQLQQTKIEKTIAGKAIARLKPIMIYAKTGDPIDAINLYKNEVNKIYQSESNLKLLSESNWAKATDELILIQDFRDNEAIYNQMFAQALAQNPNDNMDFTQLDNLIKGFEENND